MSGSSRRNVASSTERAGPTPTTAWPWTSSTDRTSSPNRARSRSPISAGDRLRDPGTPPLPDVFLADLLLQLQDPLQQRLGPPGAARNVGVDGHARVHPLRARV